MAPTHLDPRAKKAQFLPLLYALLALVVGGVGIKLVLSQGRSQRQPETYVSNQKKQTGQPRGSEKTLRPEALSSDPHLDQDSVDNTRSLAAVNPETVTLSAEPPSAALHRASRTPTEWKQVWRLVQSTNPLDPPELERLKKRYTQLRAFPDDGWIAPQSFGSVSKSDLDQAHQRTLALLTEEVNRYYSDEHYVIHNTEGYVEHPAPRSTRGSEYTIRNHVRRPPWTVFVDFHSVDYPTLNLELINLAEMHRTWCSQQMPEAPAAADD